MNEIMVQQNSISLIDSIDTQTVVATMQKIATLQAVIQKTLKPEHDYGIIPGTNKPTMFKPGGEKICMMFGLTPQYDFMDKTENYKDGFFAYNVRCTLYKNDQAVSQGVGSCNSWEKKYRYINTDTLPLDIDPSTVKSFTDRYGRVKYKIDNPDPCDLVNTILKMAKKRAFVDAVLQVASLSEVFTQDVEDMQEYIQQEQVAASGNMTADQAGAIKINFGKYKGKTLKELYKEDRGYFDWTHKNTKDQVVKQACQIMIDAVIEQRGNKSRAVQQETQEPEPTVPTQEEIDTAIGADGDMPF